jgi:hypothetical protein
MVVGEGAAPSRHANLAFPGAYKTPLHGWCYPPVRKVVLSSGLPFRENISSVSNLKSAPCLTFSKIEFVRMHATIENYAKVKFHYL